MKPHLTPSDVNKLQQTVTTANEAQTEQIVGLLTPSIEAIEIAMSHSLEDLSRDTALGFAEVHGKIEYLRGELHEIRQAINSLFR